MTVPGILTGGNSTLWRRPDGEARANTGIFGKWPGATPKYAINRGPRSQAEYQETMARLFVDIPESAKTQLYASLPPDTRPVAEALVRNGVGFMDFLLQTVQESYQEKEHIVETLSDNYVAYYTGTSAPQWSFSGTLINTYQDDQRVWMHQLYTQILRGSRLASRNLACTIRYDSFVVTGYLTSLTTSLNAQAETAAQFQFGMRVKSVETFTSIHALPSDGSNFDTTLISEINTTAPPREGVVSPETPPTAVETPDLVFSLEESTVIAALIDQGVEGVLAESILALSVQQQAAATGVDPREREFVDGQEGLDRVAGIENPENALDDAAGGETNFLSESSSSLTSEDPSLDTQLLMSVQPNGGSSLSVSRVQLLSSIGRDPVSSGGSEPIDANSSPEFRLYSSADSLTSEDTL